MRVFVTGATGFIGSAIIPELVKAGHQVLGMARSDEGAQALAEAGVEVHRGDLEDLDSLRRGAAMTDSVIHTAFNHDFSKFAANCAADRKAIEALGEGLAGRNGHLIVTSGTGLIAPGRTSNENDDPAPSSVMPRSATEEAAAAVAGQGTRVSVVRLPQVHDRLKHGLVTYAIAIARQKGVAAYVGDGGNRWPAAHRLDVARLYALVLDKGTGGRVHAVDEEGVPAREIAERIGAGLKVPVVSLSPEQAGGHFGWLAMFAGADMPSSSALTREKLGWQPSGPGMLEDLERAHEFEG